MKRGRNLEWQVVKQVEKKTNEQFQKCGLILDPAFPIFGSSPDAINDKYVLEVKCPTSLRTKEHFVKNGILSDKSSAQIQLQMFLSKREQGFFCVASPDFEKTKEVDVYPVDLDVKYVEETMAKCTAFWKQFVFPKLGR